MNRMNRSYEENTVPLIPLYYTPGTAYKAIFWRRVHIISHSWADGSTLMFYYRLVSLSCSDGDIVLTSLASSLSLLDECVLSETEGWFSRSDFMNGKIRPPAKLRTILWPRKADSAPLSVLEVLSVTRARRIPSRLYRVNEG